MQSMASKPLSVVIQNLMADLRPEGVGTTDDELLARFQGSRDDYALAALVRRHAPMVWGVFCRLLHNFHDAEDAFQATFLVLVRKAGSVPRGAVANWLYGVARQTAVRLRATAAKQGRRETQMVNMPEPTVAEVRDADLQAVLDEELGRLPSHYRGVIVLCDLENMTRREAAQELGIPEGSVASRLARARAMLAKRLAQRGVAYSGLVAVLSAGAAAAAPPALVALTIKTTSLLAAGQTAGIVSVKVAALTEGVLKAMLMYKLKAATVVLAVLATLCSITGLIYRSQAGEPSKAEKPAEKDEKVKSDKERLQGEWEIVSLMFNGNGLKADQKMTTFKGDTLRFRTPFPKSITSYCRFRLDESKTPKSIDRVGGVADDLFDLTEFDKRFDDLKQRELGIYVIDGDTLRLCFSEYDDPVRPTRFESKQGSRTTLYVFKRVDEKVK